MGLFDKLKDAADKAKTTMEQAKKAQEEKKAEQERHRMEMEALAKEKAEELSRQILAAAGDTAFFSRVSSEELLSFLKEFFDKVVLPASSVSRTHLTMVPYVSDKQKEQYQKTWTELSPEETPLLHFAIDKTRRLLLTDRSLFFCLSLTEEAAYLSKGRIPAEGISELSVQREEGKGTLLCNGVPLASFESDKAIAEDFVALENLFSCIKNRDLVITDEEVDQLIRTKIGPKVYEEVKKYMVYDDEQMVYFAWGVNSLSAKDFIVCTNRQIILIDREVLGATADVRQFYYEDITSASTLQNTKSNDLLVDLIATAIVSATQTCTLVLTVAGAAININTLYKIEAERVVAVYHNFRKLARAPKELPQAAPVGDDVFAQLEKLRKMKDLGILTEEEFNAKKAELLQKI